MFISIKEHSPVGDNSLAKTIQIVDIVMKSSALFCRHAQCLVVKLQVVFCHARSVLWAFQRTLRTAINRSVKKIGRLSTNITINQMIILMSIKLTSFISIQAPSNSINLWYVAN